MTTNSTLIHGTGRLFADSSFDRTKPAFATLKGYASFESIDPIGRRQVKVDVVTCPEVIEGRLMYRLSMGRFVGSLHRTEEDLSACRVYLGHVGPFDEFLVVGLLRNATEDLLAHIELTFTSTEDTYRAAHIERAPEVQSLEF
jgi:hypothetical protein